MKFQIGDRFLYVDAQAVFEIIEIFEEDNILKFRIQDVKDKKATGIRSYDSIQNRLAGGRWVAVWKTHIIPLRK